MAIGPEPCWLLQAGTGSNGPATCQRIVSVPILIKRGGLMAANSNAGKPANRHLAFSISAAVIGLIGLYLVIGGIWLIALGGSFYYLLGGAAIVATSVLLFLRRREALWLYAFTIVAILAGLAAAIMPARRASRLNVLDALHYE